MLNVDDAQMVSRKPRKPLSDILRAAKKILHELFLMERLVKTTKDIVLLMRPNIAITGIAYISTNSITTPGSLYVVETFL